MKFNCPLFGDQTKKQSDTKRDMSNGSLSFYNFTGHFMILAFGINSVLKDLVSIAVAKGHNSVNNSKDLFTSFRKSLQLIKPDVPVNFDECKFVNDEKTEEILAELFKTDSVLNDKNQSKIIGNKINNAEQNDMFQFIDDAIAHFS